MFHFDALKGGIVVSCQAHFDHPFNQTHIIAELATCAARGGAVGIRAHSAEHIKAIKERIDLPIIGINKVHLHGNRFFITPNFEAAKEIVDAGASAVAMEASFENQPDDLILKRFMERIHEELHVPVMADISTFEEAERAYRLGADVVSTTLSGYTKRSENEVQPNFALLCKLVKNNIPAVFEGHLRTPEQATIAMKLGAQFCVVGSAITDPMEITSWFVKMIEGES